MAAEETGAEFSLRAGRMCLDFANTVGWRGREARDDLVDYGVLLRWGVRAGSIDAREAGVLRSAAAAAPGAAERVFRRGIELREAIYRVFSAVAAGGDAERTDLAVLERELARAADHVRLRRDGAGFGWGWAESAELDRVLWPVAHSATELLTSAELARVGECAGEGCGWLYLDTSRNRSRRWCDMRDCGNRAKVRRHYERKRRTERGRG